MKSICLSLTLILSFAGCVGVKKNKIGEKYYSNVQQFLSRNYAFNARLSDSVILILLHSDTTCSCNGKNLFLVNEILLKRKNIHSYILLKDDLKNVIRNQLYLQGSKILIDTTQLLEKNGAVFRYDKIFAIKNGEYDNMFDLQDNDVKTIRSYYALD